MIQIIFLMLMASFFADTLISAEKLYTGIIGLTIPNVVIYVSVVTLVSAAVVRGQLGRVKIPGLAFLVVIMAAVSISLLYTMLAGNMPSIMMLDSVRSVKGFVFEPILLYTISFLLVRNRQQGMRFLAIYCAVIGVLNIMTLAGAYLNISMFAPNALYAESGRFIGFAGNPNKTSYVLCVGIAFQYLLMKQYPEKRRKVFFGGLILAGVVTIILTGSRGGLVGLVLLWVMMLYVWRDFRLMVLVPAILLPVFVLAMLAVGNEFFIFALERYATFASGDAEVATAGRSEIWSALFDDFLSSGIGIVIGSGYGMAKFFGIGARAHNMYLQVLIEFGVVGFIFWLVGLARAARYAIRFRTDDPWHENLRQTMLASMYVVFTAWIFTSLSDVLQLIALMFGLSVATLTSRPKAPRSVTRRVAAESPSMLL